MLRPLWLRITDQFLPDFLIRTSQTDNNRHFDAKILVGEHDAIGNHVAESESAEDVDKDGLHSWVFQNDSEGALDSLTSRFATSIEEISTFATQIGYSVDSIHGKTGTVDCKVRSEFKLVMT